MSNLCEKFGVKRLQYICGVLFILKYACQFLGRSALYFDLIQPTDTFYTYFVGIFSILGYVCLGILASGTVAELFSISFIGLDIFFMVCLPFLLSIAPVEQDRFPIIYVFCFIFSIIAIYLWSLLLNCSKFPVKDLLWILILPLTFVLNIMVYAGNLMDFEGINTLAIIVVNGISTLTLIRLCLAVILPISYWKLCHSACFSGPGTSYAHTDKYSISPFNIYLLVYGLITVILLYPLN